MPDFIRRNGIHFRHSWQEKNNSSIKQPLCQIDDLDALVIIFRDASAGNDEFWVHILDLQKWNVYTFQNYIFLQFGK